MPARPDNAIPLEASERIAAVVLVRDDALRRRVVRAIEADGVTRVVAQARDVPAAREILEAGHGDVILVDPALAPGDPVSFIDGILANRPVPVVVLAERDAADLAVRALGVGAVACVVPPKTDDLGTPAADALRRAVCHAADAHARRRPPIQLHTLPDLPFTRAATRVLGVVGGMGATAAVESLVARLPPSVPGMVVQVDLRPEWTAAWVARLERMSVLDIALAHHGAVVFPGTVHVAPGDRQVTVTRNDRGECCLDVSDRLTGHPSPDVFLSSIAAVGGRESVGVVLTGAGVAGARGLLDMRRAGARTLVESRDTAVAFGMPGAAIDLGAAEDVVDLRELPWRILESVLVTEVVAG